MWRGHMLALHGIGASHRISTRRLFSAQKHILQMPARLGGARQDWDRMLPITLGRFSVATSSGSSP